MKRFIKPLLALGAILFAFPLYAFPDTDTATETATATNTNTQTATPTPTTTPPSCSGSYINDTFTRGDSALLTTATSGQWWTTAQGIMGIDTNRAYGQLGIYCKSFIDAFSPNVSVQVTFTRFGTSSYSYLLFRANKTTPLDNHLRILAEQGVGYFIQKRVSGVTTTLLAFGTPPADGDVVKVVVTNNLIQVALNGTASGYTTESALNTNTMVGIGTKSNGMTTNLLDDFVCDAGMDACTSTETATATQTATDTQTATETRTGSPSATHTETPTTTETATETATNTETATFTATATATETATETATNTDTATRTATATRTETATETATATATRTETETRTATETRTNTNTRTHTNTNTQTRTHTATNTATNTAVMPIRCAATGISISANVYIMGGTIGQHDLSDVYRTVDGYNWTLVTSAAGWGPRQQAAGAAFDSKLWITGGTRWDGENFNDVWSSSNGSAWTQVKANATWSKRFGHTLTPFGSGMYLVGGSAFSNDVWYTTDGSTWTLKTREAAFSKRYGHSCVALGSYMYLMGGEDNTGRTLNDVWKSSDGTTWTLVTSAASWEAREHMVVTTMDLPTDRIYLIGGNSGTGGSGRRLRDVWYSTNGSTWTQVSQSTPFSLRSYAVGFSWGGALYIWTGYNGTTYLNDTVSPTP